VLFNVEELYSITYVPCTAFIVHLPERDIELKKSGKHYIADCMDVAQIHSTTRENEQLYTKTQIKNAKHAYELIKNSGYPSQEEAVHLLQDGNIYGLPNLTRGCHRSTYGVKSPHDQLRVRS
jgi:hypothetical protein